MKYLYQVNENYLEFANLTCLGNYLGLSRQTTSNRIKKGLIKVTKMNGQFVKETKRIKLEVSICENISINLAKQESKIDKRLAELAGLAEPTKTSKYIYHKMHRNTYKFTDKIKNIKPQISKRNTQKRREVEDQEVADQLGECIRNLEILKEADSKVTKLKQQNEVNGSGDLLSTQLEILKTAEDEVRSTKAIPMEAAIFSNDCLETFANQIQDKLKAKLEEEWLVENAEINLDEYEGFDLELSQLDRINSEWYEGFDLELSQLTAINQTCKQMSETELHNVQMSMIEQAEQQVDILKSGDFYDKLNTTMLLNPALFESY